MTSEHMLDLVDAGGVACWGTLGITVDFAEEGHVRLRLAMRPVQRHGLHRSRSS